MHKVELTKERNTQTFAHKNIESVKQFTVKRRFQRFFLNHGNFQTSFFFPSHHI